MENKEVESLIELENSYNEERIKFLHRVKWIEDELIRLTNEKGKIVREWFGGIL